MANHELDQQNRGGRATRQEPRPPNPREREGEAPAELQIRESEAPAELQTREGEAPAELQIRESEAPAELGTREGEAPAELESGIPAEPQCPPGACFATHFVVRRHPAHGVLIIPSQTTVVFCTICTKHRKRWLACRQVVDCLIEVWREAGFWKVGRFVVLPDHVHFFASPMTEQVDFDHWVRYWKSRFSRRHGNPDHRWQADHWDTRMRNASQYEEKWEYVRWNPVRLGLVDTPEDWPHQGEVFEIRWD